MAENTTELPKNYSFHHYVSLAVGYAFGLGWVIIPARMLLKGGPIGVLLAILLSAALLYFIAKCYAEIFSAKPVSGGEAAIVHMTYGRGIGFMTFWFLCLSYVSYGPFYASFSGVIFEALIPSIQSDVLFTIGGHDQRLSYIIPGLLIGLFVTFINLKSSKAAANLQSVSIAILFICVGIPVITGFMVGDLSNLKPFFEGDGTPLSMITVTIIVFNMMVWYLFGYSTIAQTAAEAGPDMAPNDIGRAIMLSLGIACIFYAAVHLYVPYAMPWRDAAELGMPTAEVLQATYGYDWAHKLVLIGGFMGIITTLNTSMICATRLLHWASNNGLMPAWFGVIDPQSETLKNGTKFVGFIILAGPFLALGWTSSNMGPIAFSVSALLICMAALKMRKENPDMPRPYKIKNTFVIYGGIAVAISLIISFTIPGSYEHIPLGRYAFIAIWGALGFIIYKWQVSKKDNV